MAVLKPEFPNPPEPREAEHKSLALHRRLLQRWRDADPWVSVGIAAVVLTVSARPDDVREAAVDFMGFGGRLIFIIFIATVMGLLEGPLAFLVRRDVRDKADDPEEVMDYVRVCRVVIVVLVVWTWGYSPADMPPGDPGDVGIPAILVR